MRLSRSDPGLRSVAHRSTTKISLLKGGEGAQDKSGKNSSTHSAPSVMGTAKIHATLESTTLAISSTHGRGVATRSTIVGAAIVRPVAAFTSFAAATTHQFVSHIL